MNRSYIVAISFLLHFFTSSSQSYFQQDVHYTIDVKLDDVKHSLSATESIEYTNNSPDELSFIYMHIWPNAYKNRETALAKQLLRIGQMKFHYAKDSDRGYISDLDFNVNGDTIKWEYDPQHIDIVKLILNQPLKSGEKITISTPFTVKIPLGIFSRLGHIEQQYQITQWYPKPAVYDASGWHPMPYLNQGEFYSEFGTYDVNITLPANYVVGATGDLVNGEQELAFLEEKINNTKATCEKLKADPTYKLPPTPSSLETKTLHFHQEKVHDFAWFADKKYFVLKGEVETPHTHQKVTCWAMFNKDDRNTWEKSIQYLSDAIHYYSLWNGDYPYKQVTAVCGGLSAGGGMEYPNITVISSINDDFSLEKVIMHEVGHNWFYGILGSNERDHPWMDEGLNSYNELRYIRTKYPDARLGKAVGLDFNIMDLGRFHHDQEYYLAYLMNGIRHRDQPIELPADEFTVANYAGITYSKTAIVFDYLRYYLGDNVMDKAMQEYFERWKFKHPQPKDFRKVMEEVSGKNLSWVFDDLINTSKVIDYKLCNVKINETQQASELTVKNTGEINAPFCISAMKEGKVVQVEWYEQLPSNGKILFPYTGADAFIIDSDHLLPEINRNNNSMKTSGHFKKVEPLKLQFLIGLDRPERTQLFYTPTIGWNNYNGTMLGIAFYNNIFPQKKLEYLIAPFYGLKDHRIAGYGDAQYHFYPKQKYVQEITLKSQVARYTMGPTTEGPVFTKLAEGVHVLFRKRKENSRRRSFLDYRYIITNKQGLRFDTIGFSFKQYTPQRNNFHDLSYTFSDARKLHPYAISLRLQQGDKMAKASLEANYTITFPWKNQNIHLRYFAGTFIGKSQWNSPYLFRMSGQTGMQDYLYDKIFLGRTETFGLLSQQMSNTDGNFKVLSPFGQSGKWLTALNISSSTPAFIPFRLFADIGTYGSNDGNIEVLYDAGIEFVVIKNTLHIYLPILMSSKIQKHLIDIDEKDVSQTIRFTLNLDRLQPFNALRNVEDLQ